MTQQCGAFAKFRLASRSISFALRYSQRGCAVQNSAIALRFPAPRHVATPLQSYAEHGDAPHCHAFAKLRVARRRTSLALQFCTSPHDAGATLGKAACCHALASQSITIPLRHVTWLDHAFALQYVTRPCPCKALPYATTPVLCPTSQSITIPLRYVTWLYVAARNYAFALQYVTRRCPCCARLHATTPVLCVTSLHATKPVLCVTSLCIASHRFA